MFVRVIIAVFLDTSLLSDQIHPIGTAAQGNLSQGGQIINGKENVEMVITSYIIRIMSLEANMSLNSWIYYIFIFNQLKIVSKYSKYSYSK